MCVRHRLVSSHCTITRAPVRHIKTFSLSLFPFNFSNFLCHDFSQARIKSFSCIALALLSTGRRSTTDCQCGQLGELERAPALTVKESHDKSHFLVARAQPALIRSLKVKGQREKNQLVETYFARHALLPLPESAKGEKFFNLSHRLFESTGELTPLSLLPTPLERVKRLAALNFTRRKTNERANFFVFNFSFFLSRKKKKKKKEKRRKREKVKK